jgi:uncharacterized membrane protein
VETHAPKNSEPRWPVFVALLGAGGLYAALPSRLLIAGPRWLLPASIVLLLVPTEITHHRSQHLLNQTLGYILNSVVTLAMIASLALLIIDTLPKHDAVIGRELLRSAAALWLTNIIIFASWYWRLDAGGPHERARTPGHTDGAFLFPQMTMDPAAKLAAGEHEWEPNFVDYLFLAFNTSTAISPTDVPVLSRWAKVLMMIQALISLLVIVLLAARAINIL